MWTVTWGSLHTAIIQQGIVIFTFGLSLMLLPWTAYALNQRRRLAAIKGLHGTAH